MSTSNQVKRFVSNPFTIVAFILLFSFGYLLISKAGVKWSSSVNPEFSKYISAYTAGTISKVSTIRIQLSANFGDSTKTGTDANVFSFEPEIDGKATWIDASTIEFKPAKSLPSGQKYEAVFHLNRIVPVTGELREFPFRFNVVTQSFEVQAPVFEAMDKQNLVYQRVTGTLLTADVDEDATIEKLLTARQENQPFRIRWEHAADKMTHRYAIDSIIRKDKPSEVVVSWNGSVIGSTEKGEHKIEIPSLGDFKVMNITIQNDGEQYVSVYFSDPILSNQDLNGLIAFVASGTPAVASSQIECRFTVSGNEIKCYPGARLLGPHTLTVNTGIKNVLNYPLPEGMQQQLDFADVLPTVSFLGKGVIMPSSNKLMLPFEAVGLKAVDVTVIKIFENNVSQFLQINDMAGKEEMIRVGRPVLKTTIRLDKDRLVDLRKSNRFAVELDKLIRTEPGAIYNVKLSFKKSYSLYRCDASKQTEAVKDDEMQAVNDEDFDNGAQNESSFWDSSEDYYNNEYKWSERNNPCDNSYYNPERWVSKNIFASDLGIIAKKGTTDEFLFAVTDLKTTNTLSGVTINLLDYQQQVIASGTTNEDGFARIKSARKPFMLVAKFNEQRGYLKLDDGSSLSLSQFDVSGDIVQKGLKGFIYGERGVWRPGDSIYLSFILEDRNNSLPEMHPVTMELFDPNGVLNKRMVETKSLNGFYNFSTSTDPESPTGTWTAKVKVGSVTFQKNLKIETVMPNRLKIELAFAKPYFEKSDKIKTVLKSRWLHGAIANGLKAQVDVILTPATTSFPKFSEYVFDDPTRKFTSESQTIFEGELDNNGQAKVESEIESAGESAGMLNANFSTKVFEPGGNFSVDRFTIPYHPYSSYLGMRMPKGDKARGMLLTDTNHIINIVNLKPDGSFTKGKNKVKVSLYKVHWRWWWDRSEEDLTSYAQGEEFESLQSDEVELTDGKGQWTLRVNYPQWGRYLLRVEDEGGHSTGKAFYMDWPGWAGRAQRENATEATMLTFTTDKESYKVGEKVNLTIPTAKGGRALISIESGSQVIETHWVEAKGNETRFSFVASREMMPNVYVHATLVQPHAQTVNDLPIRMYGMMPVKVEDPATLLKPQISMANEMRPDESTDIKISEATGKPMTYTLAVVDEGLLDLTRFKTPDPYAQFYAREALGVKTWDMYDFVMGAFAMQLNRILGIGGDEEVNKKAGGKKANRFKPVVKFLGPFYLPAGQSAHHKITVENYVGSVRVMVVAGHSGAYGNAEKAVPVKKPLMVLATLPRVLGPAETVKLPVTVFAMDPKIRNVTVQVQVNNLLQLMGGESKSIQFSKPGDEIVSFDVNVKAALGIAKVKVLVTSGTEKAETEIELDVRNPNPYITNVYDGSTEAGKEWKTEYTLPGMKGTNTAVLEVSSIPALNLESRLRYLVTYPHGCVEQTTSSVFPQLALKDLLELNEGWKKEITRNVTAGIQRLKGFQTAEGGMAYWQGEGKPDEWSTNYAGHFMIEAANFGYSLPVNFLPNWKKYQRNKAMSWTSREESSNDLIQAYRLYTLALAKAPELGAMNRLKEFKSLSVSARWRLAAAYVLVGQKEVALQLIQSQPVTVAKYQEMDMTYGSDVRDEAMIMETLTLLGDKSRAGQLLQTVAKHLGSDEWMSTQTTAYSLLAISKLTGRLSDTRFLEFDYKVNGKLQSFRSQSKIAQVSLSVNGTEKGNVIVSNKSGQLLYCRVITRGQPAIGDKTVAQNNLQMEIVYKDMEDKLLNVSSIAQGTDFKVEVSITNPGILGDYEQMALSQIFPSGWEIHNTRMDNTDAQLASYSVPRYRDIRDDRVYTYFNLPSKKKVTYVVLLNASYLGRFYLPGVSCEAMYNARINAHTAGSWIEVVPAQSKLISAVK